MRKVAILGGTFDPIHWGHLLIAETALSQVALEQVIWVPARCPPHKLAAKFEHRLAMVQRAIRDNPAFTISPSSVNLGISYAFRTLTDLKVLYPNTQWYWIVGLDAFQTLPRWYRRQELALWCDWLVVPRLISTGSDIDAAYGTRTKLESICKQVAQQLNIQEITIHWQLLQMPLVEISSSLIRQYCRDRCSIRYLVAEDVRQYITSHNLYTINRG